MDWIYLIRVIVCLFLVKQLIDLLCIIFNYTIGKKLFSKRKLLKQAGEWAIVTGATDGIGKVYAEELASDGLNIMLISRNEEKLLKVANEIERNYHVETRIVTADFTNIDVYPRIQEAIDQLSSIACLVNNLFNEFNKLSLDEQNEENELRYKQLSKLYELIQSNPEQYGQLTIDNIIEQMNHFYL
ncbi:putative steroid dehydrogenase [Schistosoma mansoni]|uniref:putative steroid dehydrogenase n=1 Tax=Schistosoma mansoni TaxID=6183 RepID=UPI00022DC4EA|nr:putative steroid dehydrogenase [Schistosoma mansoni]|eukprot:XP_018653400.1 putative steroid dehydrogenase [Schistosoma mansoni]